MIALVAVAMPARVRGAMYRRLLGYRIDPTARIGRSLIDVDEFRAGPGASVGALNVIRGCERVELEQDADLGPMNWINAVRRSKATLSVSDRDPAFVMRRASSITTLHFVDCCDRVEIGEYAMVGGMQSQMLTHSFDHRTGGLGVGPIVIGQLCVVGSRVLLMPGVTLGDRAVVAGGAVLPTGKYEDLSLHAGVPAKVKSSLDPQAPLFTRTTPKIR